MSLSCGFRKLEDSPRLCFSIQDALEVKALCATPYRNVSHIQKEGDRIHKDLVNLMNWDVLDHKTKQAKATVDSSGCEERIAVATNGEQLRDPTERERGYKQPLPSQNDPEEQQRSRQATRQPPFCHVAHVEGSPIIPATGTQRGTL
jgi:hypothetical protein